MWSPEVVLNPGFVIFLPYSTEFFFNTGIKKQLFELMRPSSLPKSQPKITEISALEVY